MIPTHIHDTLSRFQSAVSAAAVTHHATSMAERVGDVEEARVALLEAHRAEVAKAEERGMRRMTAFLRANASPGGIVMIKVDDIEGASK